MAHTYVSNLVHVIWSTKERRKAITGELQQRLWPYIAGIVRTNNIPALAIGGTAHHLHALLSIPSIMALAKAVQLIKGGSSKWVHGAFAQMRAFDWQEGYGAFSVNLSAKDSTTEYIQNQAAHHRTRTFEEEFLAILKKHGIAYGPKYVWG